MDRLTEIDSRTGLTTLVGFEGVYDSLSAPNAFAVENALARLAAYEDTGMTPEELDNLCRQMSEIRTSLGFKTLNDVYELVSTWRLVVLPCKVGDTVWALWDVPTSPRYVIYQAEVKEFRIRAKRFGRNISLLLEPVDFRGRWKEYLENDFGKTVFLTREEAEKALEAEK